MGAFLFIGFRQPKIASIFIYTQLEDNLMKIEDLPKLDNSEVWKPYFEAPDWYYVSNKGRVFSVFNNSLMKFRQNRKYGGGHLFVGIHPRDGRKAFNRYVHRMVALTFIANPKNLKLVRHIDDNRTNNCVDNLIWGTQKDNMQDALKNGTSNFNNSWGGDITAVHQETLETHVFTSYKELTKVTGVKRQSAYCSIRDGRVTKGWRFFR